MDLYDRYLTRSAEKIESSLRFIWDEVAPAKYGDKPTYADVPDYGDMERAFGPDSKNWPKPENPTTFPETPRYKETYGPLPRKDWDAAMNPSASTAPKKDWGLTTLPPASTLPPKDWAKVGEVLASPLPPKDWGRASKPRGPSDGP